MDAMKQAVANADIKQVCIVLDAQGAPVAASESPVDAAVFARCLGHDTPMNHLKLVPVIGFSRRDAYE